MGRVLINRLAEPDFIWSPYKDFISALNENTVAAGGSYIHAFQVESDQRSAAELQHRRSGMEPSASGDPDADHQRSLRREWNRVFGRDLARQSRVLRLQERQQQLGSAGQPDLDARPASGNGRRRLAVAQFGRLSDGRARRPVHVPQRSLVRARATRVSFSAAIDRTALPQSQQPNSNRTYQYGQDFLFAQDTYKLTPRLTVNYGVRYEFYGGPQQHRRRPRTRWFSSAPAPTLAQQLVGASLAQPSELRQSAALPLEQRFRSAHGRGLRFVRHRPHAAARRDSARFTTGPSTIFGRTSATTILFCRYSSCQPARRIFWRPSRASSRHSRARRWPARSPI